MGAPTSAPSALSPLFLLPSKNKTAQSKLRRPSRWFLFSNFHFLFSIFRSSPSDRCRPLLQLIRHIPHHPRRHAHVHHISIPAHRVDPQFPIHHRHPHMLPCICHIH